MITALMISSQNYEILSQLIILTQAESFNQRKMENWLTLFKSQSPWSLKDIIHNFDSSKAKLKLINLETSMPLNI